MQYSPESCIARMVKGKDVQPTDVLCNFRRHCYTDLPSRYFTVSHISTCNNDALYFLTNKFSPSDAFGIDCKLTLHNDDELVLCHMFQYLHIQINTNDIYHTPKEVSTQHIVFYRWHN